MENSCKSEEEKDKSKSSKIQETFLEQRKIFLWGEVSDKSARDVTEKFLYLESIDPGKPGERQKQKL